MAVRNARQNPQILLPDWPVTDEAPALRIFRFYRKRWAVQGTFKFIKSAFGIEEVQMLKLKTVRALVALAWVAAAFLLHLGLTLNQPEVRLPGALWARLSGWEERPNRPPGTLILTRGLRRVLDMFAADAIPHDYKKIRRLAALRQATPRPTLTVMSGRQANLTN